MREREGGASIVLHPAGEAVGFGPFRFDRANRILSRDGVELPLPPRVLGVLEHLVARPGSVVSKQALMDAVWKDAYVTETSLTEAVSQLRQALGDDPQQPAYVQTVHRRGYRFVAPVTLDATAGPPVLRRADKPVAATPSAADANAAAEGATSGNGTRTATAAEVAAARAPARMVTVGLLAALAIAATGLVTWTVGRGPRPAAVPVTRTAIPIAVGDPDLMRTPPALAFVPDGTTLVYALARGGRGQIFAHAMDRYESAALPGTEGGSLPFVSPDGQWVGFFAEGKLKKIPLAGGAVATLCDAMDPEGGSWGDDGTIVFAAGKKGGLFRVSSRGGVPEAITRPDTQSGELAHWWPEVLPGSGAVVFTVFPTGGLENAHLAIAPLRGNGTAPRRLVDAASFGRYAPTGYLVFARKSRLMAVGFDPARGETRGEPFTLFDGVTVDWFTGAAQYAFSRTGALAYLPGTHEVPAHALVAFDAEGKERTLPTPTRPFMNLDGAPDGRRVAVTIHEGTGSDLWVADVEKGGLTRLTFEAHNIEPAFTPDGQRVAFASSRSGVFNLFWIAADGTGAPERILEAARNQYPDSWSPDGRTLAFTELNPETGADLWVLPLDTREPRPLVRTRFDEETPAFSPDGRFVAYASNETNRWEVYVRPFPADGPKTQVSTAGGFGPVWSPDGRALYYRDDDGILAVSVRDSPSFETGPARRVLADKRIIGITPSRAVHGFLAIRGDAKAPAPQVNLVLGWFSELARLAGRTD
jgi:Tol biopolymer transport system component/DNA-binding winged helix-turn-helix (wHTH) protein